MQIFPASAEAPALPNQQSYLPATSSSQAASADLDQVDFKTGESSSKMFCRLSLLALSLALVGDALTPSSFLSVSDRARLGDVFKNGLTKDDLSSIHFSVLGQNALGETISNSQDLCKKLQAKMEGSLINIFQAATAGQALKCSSLKASPAAAKVSTFQVV